MNKTVIVTGASNGIGKAIAKAFAAAYYTVILADVDKENGSVLRDELLEQGYTAEFISCDVSDPDSIKTLIAETVKRYSGIDILINNVGISEFIPPDEMSVE